MSTNKKIAIFIIVAIVALSTAIPSFSGLVILLFFLFGFFSLLFQENHELEIASGAPISDLEAFINMKYHYLKSDIWKAKRKKRKEIDKHTCQSCGSHLNLQVHHIHGYDRIPYESVMCLVTVCEDCHEYQHKIHGFPKTLEEYYNWDAPLVKKCENPD